MVAEAGEEGVDADEEAVVDDAFVFEGGDFVFAFEAGLVDLVLLCADEGAFVDVGVDFDVGVVGELEGVPFAVVDYHCGRGLGVVWGRGRIAAAVTLEVVRGVVSSSMSGKWSKDRKFQKYSW